MKRRESVTKYKMCELQSEDSRGHFFFAWWPTRNDWSVTQRVIMTHWTASPIFSEEELGTPFGIVKLFLELHPIPPVPLPVVKFEFCFYFMQFFFSQNKDSSKNFRSFRWVHKASPKSLSWSVLYKIFQWQHPRTSPNFWNTLLIV